MSPGNNAGHGGLYHWKMQRLSSLFLIPLTLWLLWAITQLTGADYANARLFFSNGMNGIMAVLLSSVMLYHAQSGIQVVCEDYVSPPGLQQTMIWLTRAACLGGWLAVIYTVYILAQGA